MINECSNCAYGLPHFDDKKVACFVGWKYELEDEGFWCPDHKINLGQESQSDDYERSEL